MKRRNMWRAVLSLLMALTMCISLPMTVMAETIRETEAPVTNPDGTQTVVTTTTTTETNAEGNTTVTVTIEKDTTGTTTDGVTVEGNAFRTDITTSDKNGDTTGTSWEEGGSEKKEWTEEVKPGQDVPPVEVDLIPGQTTTGTASNTASPKVEGDLPEGPDDKNYDYTETTEEIDRQVSANVSDVEVEITESSTKLEGIQTENFDGKDGLKYKYDEKWDLYASDAATTEKPEEPGYDYQYTGVADVALDKYRTDVWTVTYKKDADGNPLKDENGNFIIESMQAIYGDGTVYNYENGYPTQTKILVLTKPGENGEEDTRYFTYCIDSDTGTTPGAWYKVANLEDSDYYPDEESEAHLRAIVLNGYWGTEEGTGSVDYIKNNVIAAYGENDEITVTDKDGNEYTYNVREIMEDLCEGEALNVTQAAIWSYSNGALGVQDGQDGTIVNDTFYYSVDGKHANDPESKARMKVLYEWLLGLKQEKTENITTVINDKNFVEDMALIVHDKVEDHNNNKDNNHDNDVYNTALNFTLAFVPDQDSDDLLVYLTDDKGNPINDKDGNPIIRRLAGEDSEGRAYETILPDEDGVYTLTGLQLAENEDFTFDLRLEGTQYLEQGVYIYTAYGGADHSQTMVGIAEGTQTVDVSVGVTIKFEVDEKNHVVAERKWHAAGDPRNTPGDNDDDNDGDNDGNNGGDGDTFSIDRDDESSGTFSIRRDGGDNNTLEIDDEEVPLAAAPKTGDGSLILAAISALSGMGYAGLTFTTRRKEQ